MDHERRVSGWGRSLAPLAWGLLSGLLLAAMLAALSSPAQEITILHTNDIHGAFLPRPAEWRDDRRLVGGFEALADLVRRAREETDAVLVVDAGDLMTGHPICDLPLDGVKGGALIDLMNRVGYDAMALGNHDLDISQENTRGLIRLAAFPVLCSNLVREDGSLFTGRASVIETVGELRVGLIGVITGDLAGVVQRDRIEGLRVLDPGSCVQALADSLDPLTDLIVVLSHMGLEDDRRLARRLRGVDVIVGGHSHSRLREPERVGEVLIVQAGSDLTQVGRLDLEVEGDRVVEARGRLVDLWIDAMQPQPDLRDAIGRFERLTGELFGEVLGRLTVAWKRNSRGESNLGDWITDVLREASGTDFAVLNSGGLRKDLAPGPIRRLDIYEILPFDNEVCGFTCTGRDLLEMIRTNARAQARGTHGILQVSGLSYAFREGADGAEIVEARVRGRPIHPDSLYEGASVDFVAVSQAQKYLGFRPDSVRRLGYRLNELAVHAVREARTLGAPVQGRIRRVGG